MSVNEAAIRAAADEFVRTHMYQRDREAKVEALVAIISKHLNAPEHVCNI